MNSTALRRKIGYNFSMNFLRENKTLLLCLLLSAVTFAAFYPSLSGKFLNWDDPMYVTDNSLIKDFSWDGTKKIFTKFVVGNYHPFTMLSLRLDHKLFGLNPFPFRLENVVFHIFNSLLVLAFLRALKLGYFPSVLAAFLFALHPMHVESVGWISERKDVLYSFFYLGGLLAYINVGGQKFSHAAFALFIASILSKPMAVTFPVVMLLIDYYQERKIDAKNIISKLPFFALSGLFSYLAVVSQADAAKVNYSPDLAESVMVASRNIFFYIYKLTVPFNLSAFYPHPLRINGFLPLEYYIAPIALVSAVLAIVYFACRSRIVIF
ncbi:MAG: hypothetical protein NTW04_06320, partial [Elusimicrobia bacterium]|nr:hypothetical protein [Elusimicrobiota bacterium]